MIKVQSLLDLIEFNKYGKKSATSTPKSQITFGTNLGCWVFTEGDKHSQTGDTVNFKALAYEMYLNGEICGEFFFVAEKSSDGVQVSYGATKDRSKGVAKLCNSNTGTPRQVFERAGGHLLMQFNVSGLEKILGVSGLEVSTEDLVKHILKNTKDWVSWMEEDSKRSTAYVAYGAVTMPLDGIKIPVQDGMDHHYGDIWIMRFDNGDIKFQYALNQPNSPSLTLHKLTKAKASLANVRKYIDGGLVQDVLDEMTKRQGYNTGTLEVDGSITDIILKRQLTI